MPMREGGCNSPGYATGGNTEFGQWSVGTNLPFKLPAEKRKKLKISEQLREESKKYGDY